MSIQLAITRWLAVVRDQVDREHMAGTRPSTCNLSDRLLAITV